MSSVFDITIASNVNEFICDDTIHLLILFRVFRLELIDNIFIEI